LREHRALLLAERDDLARRLDRFHEPDYRLLSRVSRLLRSLLPDGSARRRAYQMLRRLGRRSPEGAAAAGEPDFDGGARKAERELLAFAEQVRAAGAERVVAVISATPLVESEGQRPTQLALTLAGRGIPVVFVYWRWREGVWRPQDRLADAILQLPLDAVTERPAVLARAFAGRERIALLEFPWPRLSATLDALREAGWLVAYDALDDWAEFARVGHAPWYDEAFERRLLAVCDATFAVNETLAARIARLGAARVTVVRNGARAGIAATGVVPALPPGEVTVGYFGHLAGAWFDWGLVAATARARPSWRFYLIGYGGAPGDAHEGGELPGNVHLLGRRLQHELASLAASWDVAIVPFEPGKLAASADPIKIYEYLAMGLPVVTAGVDAPPGAEAFVTRADTPAGFLAALTAAAAHPRDEAAARRAFAATCTWDVRVDAMLSRIAASHTAVDSRTPRA